MQVQINLHEEIGLLHVQVRGMVIQVQLAARAIEELKKENEKLRAELASAKGSEAPEPAPKTVVDVGFDTPLDAPPPVLEDSSCGASSR